MNIKRVSLQRVVDYEITFKLCREDGAVNGEVVYANSTYSDKEDKPTTEELDAVQDLFHDWAMEQFAKLNVAWSEAVNGFHMSQNDEVVMSDGVVERVQ